MEVRLESAMGKNRKETYDSKYFAKQIECAYAGCYTFGRIVFVKEHYYLLIPQRWHSIAIRAFADKEC